MMGFFFNLKMKINNKLKINAILSVFKWAFSIVGIEK